MATDRQKPVTGEIASAASDFDIFQGFLTHLANPDKVLALECGGDITVYDDMSRDDRIGPSLRTRALAVIGREWEVTPWSDKAEDLRIAEYVKQVFLGFPFDRARRGLLRGGTLKGFALSEVMWDYSEGDVFIKDMRHRNQRRFRFDLEGNILLISRDNPMGENVSTRDGLPLRKFQHVTFGDEVETPYGVGLGRELYWPWWFKKNGVKFWLMFCDKFAGPTVKGEYPQGATEEQKSSLLSAAQAVHSNNAVIFPQGMNLSLLEAARSGSITTYKELVEYMDAAMTVVILGQTATTEGTPGALGAQDAQADVRGDLVKADADALSEALNSENGVVRWLVDYQFPGARNYPQIWIKTEDEKDELTVAERDEKRSNAVAASGARLTPVYFKRRYGLEDDEIEALPNSPRSPFLKEGGSLVDLTKGGVMPAAGEAGRISFAESARFTPEQEALESLAEKAINAASLALAGNERLIAEAVMGSSSFEEAMQKVMELYPAMNMDRLASILEAALVGAQGFGRFTAAEESGD